MTQLAAANAVRFARRDLRVLVANRQVTLAEVLADPPPCVVKMQVVDLLQWTPRIGRIRARAILRSMKPPMDVQVEMFKLSPERRQELARAIENPSAIE